MIHVIAIIEVVDGHRMAFLEEFHRVMPMVQAEEGCLEYGPAVDVESGIPVQSPVRANVVTIIEKWASLTALKAHLQAPHMLDYRLRVKPFVAGVKLQVLEPA
jgi:quinol monooxygenase YgiN